MSRYSELLERHRLQTEYIPSDRWMHTLTKKHGVDEPTKVLYRRKGGGSGQLGGGSFGAVHLEILASDCDAAPDLRAVKSISKRIAEASRIKWQQEVQNLLILSQYPASFVTVYGWWEDEQYIYLPMEYFEASDLSRNHGYIRNEEDIRVIAYQIVLGLEQMHSLGIIHRDIKPQNIFVVCYRPEWHVKIGDFGFSKRISDSVSAPFSTLGTHKYMAPEYVDPTSNCESSDYTTAVDMWSFGCLVYELFARRCPFDDGDALREYMYNGIFPRKPLNQCGASNGSIEVISNVLDRNPYLRWSARDVIQSSWFNGTEWFDVIKKEAQDDSRQVFVHHGETGPSRVMTESLPRQREPCMDVGTDGRLSTLESLNPHKIDGRPRRPLTGIKSSALGGMGGLSRIQWEMLENAPPEMKPFMRAHVKARIEEQTKILIEAAETAKRNMEAASGSEQRKTEWEVQAHAVIRLVKEVVESWEAELRALRSTKFEQSETQLEDELEKRICAMKRIIEPVEASQHEIEVGQSETRLAASASGILPRNLSRRPQEIRAHSSFEAPTIRTWPAEEPYTVRRASSPFDLPPRPKSSTTTRSEIEHAKGREVKSESLLRIAARALIKKLGE